MSKKSHVNWHDIELYLQEKISREELGLKKDRYVEELLELKHDCEVYSGESRELYQLEKGLYCDRLKKNKKILNSLKLVFPEDKNLLAVLEDL